MMDLSLQLVRGLQGAISQSAFGALICFTDQNATASSYYNLTTLTQLGQEIQLIDSTVGDELLRAIPRKDASGLSAEKLQESWIKFTNIIEGVKAGGGDGRALEDLFTHARNKLLIEEDRARWIAGVLKQMNAPEIAVDSASNWLMAQGPIGLRMALSSDRQYHLEVISEDPNDTRIHLYVPKFRRFINKSLFEKLIAHAVAIEAVSGPFKGTIKRAKTRLPESAIGTPTIFLYEATLLQKMIAALNAERFQKYLHLVPQKEGFAACYNQEVLMALASAIGSDDPNLGSRLLVLANKAGSEGDKRFRLAWSSFIDALSGARDIIDLPLIDQGVFGSASAKLSDKNPNRREWLTSALKEMRVPSPMEVLDSSPVNLSNKEAIHITLSRIASDEFRVYSNMQSNSSFISVRIGVPAGITIDSEEQVKFLVARALLLAKFSKHIPESIGDKYHRIKPDAIKDPVTLCVIGSGSFMRYGPMGLSDGSLRHLVDEHLRLRAAVAMTNVISGGRNDLPILDNSNSPSARLWEGDSLNRLRKHAEIWKQITIIPGVSDVFVKHASFLRASSFSFILESDESLGSKVALNLSINDPLSIAVRASSATMRKLRSIHLAEIFVRASGLRQVSSGNRVYRERLYEFDSLLERDPLALSDRLRLGRSLFMALRDVLIKFPFAEADGLEVEGDVSEYALSAFAGTLEAVAKFTDMNKSEILKAAWGEVLSTERWFISSSPSTGHEEMISVIPMHGANIIHIEGNENNITPLEWLYVLSGIAANPGQAIKINSHGMSFAIGDTGDSKAIYGSIASNRIFKAYELFDPSARVPDIISYRFPGDELPEKNARYAQSSAEEKLNYIKALRWFAAAVMPEEWKPRAGDDTEVVKKKRREMTRHWHPDVNRDEVKANMLTISNTYWEFVFAMHGVKKNQLLEHYGDNWPDR